MPINIKKYVNVVAGVAGTPTGGASITSAAAGGATPGKVTNLVLTAMAGAVSAAFTVPSGATNVTVTLSNGLFGSSSTSPLQIASPAGTAVTATAIASNAAGPGPISDVSNSVTPTSVSTPATAVTLTGPTSGVSGVASSAFTVGIAPTGFTTPASILVTPSDSAAGGTFTPTSLTLTPSAPTGTFTYTPASTGAKSISVTNNATLTNPNAVVYTATAAPATAITMTGPINGVVGVASSNYSVTLSPTGGTVASPVTVTPSDAGGGGAFNPTTVSLTTAAPNATFTYTPVSSGAKTISVTNNGGLTNPSAMTYTASASNKTITQAMSPYTILAADNGVPLIAQPTLSAGIQIVHTATLGTSFVTTVTQDAAFPALPVEIVESGTTGFNSNGLRIKSSASQALGLGSPLVRGPGLAVTITNTSNTSFNLTGALGRWQQVASHNSFPDAFATNLFQISGFGFYRVKGKAGAKLNGMRISATNVYGLNESIATTDIQFSASVAMTSDTSIAPQLCYAPDSTTVRTVTLTGGVKSKAFVEVFFATPFVYSGAWQTIQIAVYQTGAGGCVTGKGKDFSEYYNYSTTATPSIDKTTLAFNGWGANPNGLQSATSVTSSQRFAPFTIEGITETGAIIGLGDSRTEPSNGDWPTVGEGTFLCGELDRVYGNQGVVLNLASFGDSAQNFSANSGANSTMRRSQAYLGGNVAYGYGANDLGAASQTDMNTRPSTLLNMAEFLGRIAYAYTIPPCLVSSTDMFTTLTNQSFSTTPITTQNGYRVGFNNALRAGTIARISGYAELADVLESARDSGKWKISGGRPRTLSDVVSTAASNVYSSASGAFASDDVGKYFVGPFGASSATIYGLISAVTATTVTIISIKPRTAYNATVTSAAATAYIQALEYVQPDGNHEMQNGGGYITAAINAATFVPPTIPVVPVAA